MGGDVVEDGPERRVIGEHVGPVLSPELHPHDLVQLHRDRAGVEVGIEPRVHASHEARLLEVIGIDGGGDGGPALRQTADRQRMVHCGSMLFAKRIAVVDERDVQRPEVEAGRTESATAGTSLVGVEVSVDRCDRKPAATRAQRHQRESAGGRGRQARRRGHDCDGQPIPSFQHFRASSDADRRRVVSESFRGDGEYKVRHQCARQESSDELPNEYALIRSFEWTLGAVAGPVRQREFDRNLHKPIDTE
jgi:hypothetical protein